MLERCSIPGLIRYVVLFNALVFVLHYLSPNFIFTLALDPKLVLQGELWRLITWIFIPGSFSPFWILALFFLLFLGDGLEQAVGSSRTTLFYLSGMMLCTFVAFSFGLAGAGIVFAGANIYLNLSLLLALATICPDLEILVMYILPVKLSWIAIISTLFTVVGTLGQPPVFAATLGAVFVNYLLFFHRELRTSLGLLHLTRKSGAKSMFQRLDAVVESSSLHHCEHCGRTELSNPDLDFRVTRNGFEYCIEHLPK